MLNHKILTLAAAMLSGLALNAQDNGQQKPPTLEEVIQQEVERLERTLKLEDWQVFYVDSTLTYNYGELSKEMEALQKSRVENASIYQSVQDKWMVKTEAAYKKFFTAKQWDEYLRQGGEKIIKDREKRQKQALQTKQGKNKK